MDIDKKKIRKGILTGLGYSKAVSAYDDDNNEFNKYTGIQHQIKKFLDEITKLGSEFQLFEFNEDDYIKMGIRIIKSKRDKGQFYSKIRKHHPEIILDFLLDPIPDYNKGIKYCQEHNYEYSEIINDIHRYKRNINNVFKDYVMLESYFYREIENYIEIMENVSERIIVYKADFYNAGYWDLAPCFIDIYMDLVIQFVKSLVYLVKNCSTIHSPLFPFINDTKEFMDRLMYGLDDIEHGVEEFVEEYDLNYKDENNPIKSLKSYNEKVRAFSNYLRCKSLYCEYQKTMEVLYKENDENHEENVFLKIINNPQYDRIRDYKGEEKEKEIENEIAKKGRDFDYLEYIMSEEYKNKYHPQKLKDEKIRLLITLGIEDNYYTKRKDDLESLLKFAREIYLNDFLDPVIFDVNALYNEFYKSKSNSPIFHKNATTVMREITEGKLIKQDNLPDFYDLPLLTRQKLRFLDMKILRWYICNNYSKEYYKLFSEAIVKMWDILLKSFRTVNECRIYETIRYTGTLYAQLISSDFIFGIERDDENNEN